MRRTIYIVLGFAGALSAGWMIFARVVWGATFIDSGFEGKTLWEWMELLIIPFALAVFGFWTNYAQNKRDRENAADVRENERQIAADIREAEREIAEREREKDREIAEKERETDRELARDRQRQNTLDRYFDKMGEFIGDGIFDSQPEEKGDDSLKPDGQVNPKLKLAKSITVVTIGDLDEDRNQQLFQFLQEADLIKTGAIEFINSDLKGADLKFADLSGVNLNRAGLAEARLGRANLKEASLEGANLVFANLEEAFLTGANLSRAFLTGANLFGVYSAGANLSRAFLTGANLSNARLTGTILIEANLSDADLSGAYLPRANLSGAYWGGSNLTDAVFDEDTIMPDGQKWYEGWFSDQEGEAQD